MAEGLNPGPPRWLEAAVRIAVPPGCREHVLGDFCEQYASPLQYAQDALRTLPLIIAGQIRRTSDPLQLLMHFVLAFVFFGGLGGRPGVTEPVAWFSALPPTIAVMIALVLRAAYRSAKDTSSRHAFVDATFAVLCASLSQAAVAAVLPQWLLALPAALGGSVGTFVAIFVLRASVPREADVVATAAGNMISIEEFSRDVRRFERRTQQRNRREVLAGMLVVVGFGAFLWRGPEVTSRIGCGLAMAGALFVIYRIRTHGVVRPVPANAPLPTAMALYRRELERQRNLLRTVIWWYLLPLLPGMLVLTFAQAVTRSQPAAALRAFGFLLVIGALIARLNQRGARKLQQKIDRLTAALEQLA